MSVEICIRWLVGLLLTINCVRQIDTVGFRSFRDIHDTRHFDYVITNYMRERKVPGASIALSKNGKFLLRKGYGRAGDHRIVTPWSLFRIGSVSKPVTALGIMKLVEQGKVSLNQTVFGLQGLLPEYTPLPTGDQRLLQITLRHLLQHTGGWDQRVTGDPLLWREIGQTSTKPASQATVISYMMAQPLQHAPGTKYAYSNLGYMILGRIIQRISGMTYEMFITSVLWKVGIFRMKIGKTRKADSDLSEVEYFSNYPANRVMSVFKEDGLVSPPYGAFHLENLDSSSGWIASATDLVQLFDSLNGTHKYPLLNPDTFKIMVERPPYTQARRWYGFGLVVQDNGKSWWHSGALDGSIAMATHHEGGYTWAVLMNYRIQNNDLDDLVQYAIRQVRTWSSPNSTDNLLWTKNSLIADALSKNRKNLVRLMIPEEKFSYYVKLISDKHYRLTWIDAYEEYGLVYFNTIWAKNNGTKWKAFVGMSSTRYKRKFKSRIARGYRLLHVETYVSRRKLRYAAVFIRDVWPAWLTYHGFSPHRHKTQFYQYLNEGYRLVVQSVTEYKGKLYIAAIYDKLPVGEIRVRMGLSSREYAAEFEKQVDNGRTLSYVQAYEQRGHIKFSAIWVPETTKTWAASHDMTKYTLLNKLSDYARINVPLACITGYHNGDVMTFATLWR